jgi:ubiquinone/menaquinone biosynthesis C-methylase UbiE
MYITDLVIRENQVDAVVSTLTLSSCKDVGQVLREIRRILKPVNEIFLFLLNTKSRFFCRVVFFFIWKIFVHQIFSLLLFSIFVHQYINFYLVFH